MMRLAVSRAAVARVGVRAFATEIPITQVARVAKMNVENESGAVAADALVAEMLPILREVPGFVKFKRTVCKSEWAYETETVFDSLDSFKAYMESDVRANKIMPFLAKGQAIAKGGEVYQGNRVYDEM